MKILVQEQIACRRRCRLILHNERRSYLIM